MKAVALYRVFKKNEPINNRYVSKTKYDWKMIDIIRKRIVDFL